MGDIFSEKCQFGNLLRNLPPDEVVQGLPCDPAVGDSPLSGSSRSQSGIIILYHHVTDPFVLQ